MSDVTPRRTYNPPEIQDLGTLAELTAASGTPQTFQDSAASYGPTAPGSS